MCYLSILALWVMSLLHWQPSCLYFMWIIQLHSCSQLQTVPYCTFPFLQCLWFVRIVLLTKLIKWQTVLKKTADETCCIIYMFYKVRSTNSLLGISKLVHNVFNTHNCLSNLPILWEKKDILITSISSWL